MPDGGAWPRITVVTPSYNQARFLEATVRSVLLQGYPDLEYIVIDGGSTDGSDDVIRRYEQWLGGYVSEPDEGQSHAINKGLARATGEIFAWLNSDDLYEPSALAQVARHFAREPDCALLYGRGSYVDEKGTKQGPCSWIRPFDRRLLLTFNFILQPAAFWRRWLWDETGGLDEKYHWAMDWDWLIRASARTEPHFVPIELARWRVQPEMKTASGGEPRRAEIAAISRRYSGFWQPTNLAYLLDRLSWRAADRLGDGLAFRTIQRVAAPLRWLLKEKAWKGRYQD